MATWMGGMIFLAAVVLPILRRGDPAAVGQFMGKAAPRLRMVGWVSLVVLGLTGWGQMLFRGLPMSNHLILSKIVIFLVIVIMSIAHDFWLGPRASLAMQTDPGSPETLRLRRVALMMGRVTALLALVAVTLGVFIVRGVPW